MDRQEMRRMFGMHPEVSHDMHRMHRDFLDHRWDGWFKRNNKNVED